MTLFEAVRKGKWLRRRGTTKVVCVSENPTNLYGMVRSDFLANDWEVLDPDFREESDASERRFSLMELE